MNNASLELGGTNWAEKDGNILGYSVGDTSGNFSPQEFTFARGSNLSATRIDRAGLIEKGRENLLRQSNSFDTTWNLDDTTITSGQSGYDGSSDAWLVKQNTATSRHLLWHIGSVSGIGTISIYAKAKELQYLQIATALTTGDYANFDLSDGSIGNFGSDFFDAKATSVGDGWYRLSVVSKIGTNNIYISLVTSKTAPWLESFAGANSTDGLYIQDAQLEQGLAASPYIETTTTTAQAGVLENTPRLNYTTGVANPYLLLEPSRTNLVDQSELFNVDASWIAGGRPAVQTNVIVSPEGAQNGSRLAYGVNNALRYGPELTFTNGYSYSIFVKKDVGRYVTIYAAFFTTSAAIGFDLDEGTCQAGGVIEPYGDEWYRISVSNSVAGDVDKSGYFYLYSNSVLGATSSTSGNKLYVYGAQIEDGSYPTSYIPTYSVSATRAADACSKTNASGVIGQTEGTLFAEIQGYANALSGNSFLSLTESTGNNRLLIGQSSSINQLRVFIDVGTGANGFNYSVTDITQPQKIAIVYSNSGNTIAIYVNGVKETGYVVGDTFNALLTDITFDNGSSGQNAQFNVNELQVYKEALTDAEAITLTTI